MKKIIILTIAFALLISNVCFAECSGWMSSDPNDLLPLAGSKWCFVYDYDGVIQTKFIDFSKEVIKVDDGTVCLICVDLEWQGMTMYGDYVGIKKYGDYLGIEERGFICILLGPDLFTTTTITTLDNPRCYLFTVYKDIAMGIFINFDSKNPSEFKTSSLLGTKIPKTPVKALNSKSSGSSGSDSGMGCFISLIALQPSAK